MFTVVPVYLIIRKTLIDPVPFARVVLVVSNDVPSVFVANLYVILPHNISKYKALFHEKAHMLSFDEVNELIGHPVGGVCPFAINEGVIVYLDESLKRFKTVFPACGSGNSAIELSIEELEKYSNYKEWIDVSNY